MKDAPALVWPRLLELPSEDVNLVYLDLNHWISFAQASTGHSSGVSFVRTLEACRAAKSAGSAVFVLSAIHYMEMNKIKDPSQRRAIADVMEDLTGFASLMDRVVVTNLELDAMLDRFAQQPSPLSRIHLLGKGVRHVLVETAE
jgi:sugar/nucleoside kinase (ribokinase family)